MSKTLRTRSHIVSAFTNHCSKKWKRHPKHHVSPRTTLTGGRRRIHGRQTPPPDRVGRCDAPSRTEREHGIVIYTGCHHRRLSVVFICSCSSLVLPLINVCECALSCPLPRTCVYSVCRCLPSEVTCSRPGTRTESNRDKRC
jgi:hypothetical protein